MISLDVDSKNVTIQLHCIENCEYGAVEGHVYNLHPEYVFPESELLKDKAFPWIKDLHHIVEKQQSFIETEGLVVDHTRKIFVVCWVIKIVTIRFKVTARG